MTPKRDDSYKVLFFAIPFVVGGIILLCQKGPAMLVAPTLVGRYVTGPVSFETASVNMEHAAGLAGLAIAGLIVWFYFKIRT